MGIAVNVLSGCASNQSRGDDVWTLLARGEGDRARPFFLGEVDVNDRDSQGRTPLHIATEIQDPVLANFFISLGAEVDALDGEGRTPLAISAELRDGATARVIVNGGADIHFPMGDDLSPAIIAVRENGEFIPSLLSSASIISTNYQGRTILHLAALAGNAGAVDAILRSGFASNQVLVNQRDGSGMTALDIALTRYDSRDHAEAAESLILAGAVSDEPLYTYFAPAVRTSNFNIRSADGMAPLHFMARSGYRGYLEFAIERRADVNIKNSSGSTPLHEAARFGDIRIVQILLENGADINAQDANGNSVLHLAIPRESQYSIVNLLLYWGINPNIQDEHGDSILHTVIALNSPIEVLEILLESGSDVNLRNIEGKTPLYIAVEKVRIEYIPLLLSYNSNIFALDNNAIGPFERALMEFPSMVIPMISPETVLQNDSTGNTLLHMAVRAGADTVIISRILSHDAPIEARNMAGDTPMILAVRHNRREAGELLLSRGANIFTVNSRGESPLFLTFPQSGQSASELRQWMLTNETLTSRDSLGNTALHYAAHWQLDAWIPLMVSSGAVTEAVNAMGETALFSAVKQDSASTIRALANSGSQITARDSQGNSPLHTAVAWGAPNGARVLLDLGIDINGHNLHGKTALHETVRIGMTDIESILLWRGANTEVRDNDGNTVFMEAIIAGNAQAMERLISHGADPNSRNYRGDTPLHIAVAMERTDVVNLLLNWGASIHARNSRERTPFMDALITSPLMVSTLLTRDRLIQPDDNGSSPLHIAVLEYSPISMINLITELGARSSSLDFEGRTPLRLALELAQFDTAKLLADSGSDVFISARDGRSAAELALEMGEAAVRALFTGRAIYSRDSSGNTILHYAARNGNTAVISLLMSLGAGRDIRNIAAESPADIAMRWNHRDAAALLMVN